MTKNRIEAFSDGVIAIIITIMVLELKAPHDASPAALLPLAPVFLSYALSFLVVAIMWVNHHHVFHIVRGVDARLLWSNILLLFWMSLIPFVTSYLGENSGAPFAVALYGAVLTLAAWAFTWLRYVVSRQHLADGDLSRHNASAIHKNVISALLYTATVPLAYISVYLAYAVFVLIPVLYFLPERQLAEHAGASPSA